MRRASFRTYHNLRVTFRMWCQIATCCGDQKGFCALVRKPKPIWVELGAKAGLGLDLLAASYEKV